MKKDSHLGQFVPPGSAGGDNWLDDDRGIRRFGYAVFLAFAAFVFVWGVVAPIESAAIAPGIVQVEGKRKSLQHLEGGIVADIAVANGDRVIVGDPLVTLDATRVKAERDILKGRTYNKQARVDRLVAERDDKEALTFSDALSSASSADSRAKSAMLNERALFVARFSDRSGEEDVLYSQRKGLDSVLKAKVAVDASLRQEIQDLEALLAEGYVDKQRLRELQRSQIQALGEMTDLTVSLEEVDLRILQLKKRFKTEVVDELDAALDALYDTEQQYAAAEDRMLRATIRAPVDGTVLNLIPNTIGSVLRPGETILEIVPSFNNLIVEARVSPMDIDRVSIGQTAEIRFSVFKDAYMVSGILTKLSADRLIDQETNTPYYAAEIKLLEEDLFLLDGMSLVPGMPAEVLIKTGQRTMLGYVTSPMNRTFSRSLTED
ncbi:HlyD family type I secretion periplasmic adaptor subunit [Luminiphilus sp.]|nr:HlyD family type I secretion periplasmic adaptor subunit [Luminiphilus sp.]